MTALMYRTGPAQIAKMSQQRTVSPELTKLSATALASFCLTNDIVSAGLISESCHGIKAYVKQGTLRMKTTRRGVHLARTQSQAELIHSVAPDIVPDTRQDTLGLTPTLRSRGSRPLPYSYCCPKQPLGVKVAVDVESPKTREDKSLISGENTITLLVGA